MNILAQIEPQPTTHYGMAVVVLVTFAGVGYLMLHWSRSGFLTVQILGMLFGFCVLFLIVSLVYVVAVFKVEERFSFGLMPLITIVAGMAGAWSAWFSHLSSGAGKSKAKTQQDEAEIQPEIPDSSQRSAVTRE